MRARIFKVVSASCNPVILTTVLKEPDGTPKGFGFVSMDDAAQGRAAVAALAGATVQGQAVAVSEMKV